MVMPLQANSKQIELATVRIPPHTHIAAPLQLAVPLAAAAKPPPAAASAAAGGGGGTGGGGAGDGGAGNGGAGDGGAGDGGEGDGTTGGGGARRLLSGSQRLRQRRRLAAREPEKRCPVPKYQFVVDSIEVCFCERGGLSAACRELPAAAAVRSYPRRWCRCSTAEVIPLLTKPGLLLTPPPRLARSVCPAFVQPSVRQRLRARQRLWTPRLWTPCLAPRSAATACEHPFQGASLCCMRVLCWLAPAGNSAAACS